MVDLCSLNPLNCLHNGQCRTNTTSNTTYCLCGQCRWGIVCEMESSGQSQFDTTCTYLIVFSDELFFSLLNNSLALELFLKSKRIRRSNCGVYLIVYSILSFIASFLLAVNDAIEYHNQSQPISKPEDLSELHCYLGKIGYNTLIYLCIWFGAFMAFEHALFVWFNKTMNANRRQSLITTIVILAIAVSFGTPLLAVKCDWDSKADLASFRTFSVWFFIIMGIFTYLLAIVLLVVGFTRRIRRYGTENGSWIRTFLTLFYRHLFMFVPPIAYGIGHIPYSITYNVKNDKYSYFQCGISLSEYIVKVIMEALPGVPYGLTWLLFIYPSKVYMTEQWRRKVFGNAESQIQSMGPR